MTGVLPPTPLATVQRDAQTRFDSGDVAAARALLTHALESARPAYGADHPDVLATAHLLARFHRAADDPAAARRVLEEALADGHLRLGDSDPLILAISYDLGCVADELGNRHEARRNFSRVATAGPSVLGEDHWTVRAAREYLGDQSGVATAHRTPAPISIPPPVEQTQGGQVLPRATSPAPSPPPRHLHRPRHPRRVTSGSTRPRRNHSRRRRTGLFPRTRWSVRSLRGRRWWAQRPRVAAVP